MEGRTQRPAWRLRRLSGAIMFAGGIIALLLLAPGIALRYSCPFHELTGMSCLSCGMTRSFAALGTGDLASALGFHPLGPVLMVAMGLLACALLAEALSGRVMLGRVLRSQWRWGAIVVGGTWLIFGVARMALEWAARIHGV
jgi:hypothetical protein